MLESTPSFTFVTMTGPDATDTFAVAINDRGEFAGYYIGSSGQHGFIDDNGTFTTLNAQGATYTAAHAINDRGEIVGLSDDSSGGHGFVYDNGTYTTLSAPGASSTDAAAINDRGDVAGFYSDSGGARLGFIYDNDTYTSLIVPCATSTDATAIDDRGEVAEYYEDSSGTHGFLATPHGGEASFATFGELLSAHAHHGGLNDLLPGLPGIWGGPTYSARASGMMDRTLAAGARLVSFGGLASDHTAAQALLHANGTSPGTG